MASFRSRESDKKRVISVLGLSIQEEPSDLKSTKAFGPFEIEMVFNKFKEMRYIY